MERRASSISGLDTTRGLGEFVPLAGSFRAKVNFVLDGSGGVARKECAMVLRFARLGKNFAGDSEFEKMFAKRCVEVALDASPLPEVIGSPARHDVA